MAKLVIPNIFTPGTPAQASQMNANFEAVANWTASGQVTTDSIQIPLGFRSNNDQGQSQPILQFLQQNDDPILDLINNNGESSIVINQLQALDAGAAVILIEDNVAQSQATSAALKMILSSNANSPAILINHGAETLNLTKTQLKLFNNALQFSGTAVNFFTDALQASSSEILLFNSSIKLNAERIKIPVKTAAERDAIVTPEEGSLLYNSTTKFVQYRDDSGWKDFTPSGIVQMFAGSTPPTGWLYCNGQAVSRTTYADLFAAIGTTYGSGDNSTTFNLPNFVGIFPRGAAMGSTSTQAISGITYTGGSNNTKQADQMQGHHHIVRRKDNDNTFTNYHGFSGGGNGALTWRVPTDGDWTGDGSVAHAKDMITNGSHGTPRIGTQTHPANMSIAFIIKA